MPHHDAVVRWLSSPDCRAASMFDRSTSTARAASCSNCRRAPLAWNMPRTRELLELARSSRLQRTRRAVRHRPLRRGTATSTRASSSPPPPRPRCARSTWASDIFIAAGTPLHATLPGKVLSVVDNDMPYDYGPTVILDHRRRRGRSRSGRSTATSRARRWRRCRPGQRSRLANRSAPSATTR